MDAIAFVKGRLLELKGHASRRDTELAYGIYDELCELMRAKKLFIGDKQVVGIGLVFTPDHILFYFFLEMEPNWGRMEITGFGYAFNFTSPELSEWGYLWMPYNLVNRICTITGQLPSAKADGLP